MGLLAVNDQEGVEMAVKAEVAYTKHGLRRHYSLPRAPLTLCWRPVVPLETRSRLFRHRLVQASFCGRCEQAEEQLP